MATLCTYNGVSTCDKESWAEQRKCDQAVKATRRDCCMHYCANGRCDSPDAQEEARSHA